MSAYLPTVPLFRTHVECHVSCVPPKRSKKRNFPAFWQSGLILICYVPLNTTSRPDFSVAQVGMYVSAPSLNSQMPELEHLRVALPNTRHGVPRDQLQLD